jgi:predicted LPLAT superfamily acyltransferase
VVVDSRSAERLGRVLREASNDSNLSVIPVDPDGMATALRVRDAIQRGELVGILADRVMDRRNVTVDFLGAPAELPAGPYILAHTLKCPVFLVCGLFSEPNRYDLYCEPFSDAVRLDRKAREESLRKYAQQYADRLEHYARRAPYNWFNFYDFWAA